jgi:hypothetical protein
MKENIESTGQLPDFSGKVVWFEIAGSLEPRGGVLLEFVEFKRLGDRLFVVGRLPQMDASGWLSGADGAVAWDSVIHFVTFKSREDYEKRAATFKPSLREKLFR